MVVVVGYGRDEVSGYLAHAFGPAVRTAVQETQRGTGHAVLSALPALAPATSRVLVLYGDTPLLEPATLQRLVAAYDEAYPRASLAMLTLRVADPTGYGRIERGTDGSVLRIVEHKDATAELGINEVNPGIYLVDAAFLREKVPSLTANNAQGELYLTDLVEMAASLSGVAAVEAGWDPSLAGINDRAQLAAAENVVLRSDRRRSSPRGRDDSHECADRRGRCNRAGGHHRARRRAPGEDADRRSSQGDVGPSSPTSRSRRVRS